MKHRFSNLRTNDKRVLEAWMNMEMYSLGKTGADNMFDGQYQPEVEWKQALPDEGSWRSKKPRMNIK